ncbi:MAG: methyltransferase [Flavobacteriaceae bacterium]|nr:MAG: methyltransferase [Flavobacteriaceae bacterium]
MYKEYPHKRYKITLDWVKKHVSKQERILDLGIENPFSEILKQEGYTVFNTKGEDLDLVPEIVKEFNVEVVTGFEILEHLVSPLPLLKELPVKKALFSVPLSLWFAPAYQSKTDPWDRHYHEFEDWQFDWLMEKSGWEVTDRIKWAHPVKKIGFRPILRSFTPRYYAVCVEKKG